MALFDDPLLAVGSRYIAINIPSPLLYTQNFIINITAPAAAF